MRLSETTADFLGGGGEMGARIRAYDWTLSILGPPANWPQGLKTAVRVLLSTGHPMFIWWGPELIQFYNDAYRRSIGPERHPSALGQRGRECWDEIWPIIGPQIEQVMRGGGFTWHENQLVPITRHGRREDVYWTYSYGPIDEPSAPNGIGGVLVVCTETTAQVLAEQRMKAAEARWRDLFTQAPGFMCILQGPEHVFEFANPRYYDLIGHRDIIGKPVREALPEVESQGFVALLDHVYRSGQAHIGTAAPVILASLADGHRRQVFVDFVYQPIRDANDQVTGIFVEGSNVTERVRASESLRAEDQRKDEFLAMLAHELRNPLAPIRNVSSLLSKMSNADEMSRALGGMLDRQVTQLTRLVDDLLDVSRITCGRIELQRMPVELGSAIALAIETVQPLINDKRHQLTYRPATVPLHVDGDLARLTQCIVNIVTNAAKYTAPGGSILITARSSAGMAIVEVTDNGAGIAAEMLPRIFDLFVQADRTLERSQGGLGIGLSVVQKLIHMHGGRVSASSEGLGRGATFSISLPLIIESPSQRAQFTKRQAMAPKRVLIVDDNVDAAESLAQVLRIDGHVIETAYDAHEALDRYQTFSADIVLLDIGLPGMDGYEVAGHMRAARAGGKLVALTGYGQANDVERALAAGFDAHITKPVNFTELQWLLESGVDEMKGAVQD